MLDQNHAWLKALGAKALGAKALGRDRRRRGLIDQD
jgi:hypothetical protein